MALFPAEPVEPVGSVRCW